MQFRMSPGGSILKSSRNRPDEPPSSVTVTTAESSRMLHGNEGQGTGVGAWTPGAFPIRIPRRRSGVTTYRFSPRSRVDNPVPPPIATTRSSFSLDSTKFGDNMREVSYPSLNEHYLRVGCRAGLDLWIKQLRKPWIIRHILKVRIRTRLDSVPRILTNRLRQVFQAPVRVARHAGQHRQPIERIIGLVIRLQDQLELLAGIFIVPIVQQRHGVVIMLFMAGKRVLSLRRLKQTRIGVHPDAIAQFAGARRQHLLESCMGLVVLAVLHQSQCRLILRNQMCACSVRRRECSSQRTWSTLCCRYICCLCLSHSHSCHLRAFLSLPILTVARYSFIHVSVLYADLAVRSTGSLHPVTFWLPATFWL